ncbi:MAG: DUF2075 domain-containing protein [Clostridia bacterium]|nr:DUF2075 domain-containing protein [Clostridia bacterium]
MATIDTFAFDVNVSDNLKSVRHYGKNIGENWPIVYVINNDEEAYIGETHHASVRMVQHQTNPDRNRLTEIRIISGDDFNKSVILDLESFLIQHMGADGKYKLQNGNNGLQDHDYYNRNFYQEEFRKIWNKLKKEGVVNRSITEIENSNIYKYSPYKSLGEDQIMAEKEILSAFAQYSNRPDGVTIIVRGGAGTGKTILAIYLMKLFADVKNKVNIPGIMDEHLDEDAETITASESLADINKIGIVFPQSTLKESVKDVFKSIGGLSKDMVLSTKEVVDEYVRTGEQYDLLIVDEAHRLKCRNKGHLQNYQFFDGCSRALGIDKMESTELDWILRCSKNQIIFRDELQTVRPCDIDGEAFNGIIEKKYGREPVILGLDTQWRCEGGNGYINYVRNILSNIDQPKKHFDNYDFKLYKDVDKMVKDIKELNDKIGLCRNAAGYAWKWASKKDKSAYDIHIQGHDYRWNSTYTNWIAKDTSIDEIGCIHTLQGYDLNYVGLIIGEDIKYNPLTHEIYADKDCYYDQQGKSGVAFKPDELKQYLLNIYLTLMTRGIKGTYLYICDDALREYFENYVEVK